MDCDWPIDRNGCWAPPDPLADDATDEQVAERALLDAKRAAAEEMAIDILWALSGRQFGCHEVTARPCSDYAQGFGYVSRLWLYDYDYGNWAFTGCGCFGGQCTVTGPRVVHLAGPVVDVTEVKVNGLVISDASYQLEGDALYRTSGESWPRQNLGSPLGEDGTWSVKYLQGIQAPALVGSLTAALALELVNACTEDAECRIPRTVTSTSRRGVSYEFDPSKLLGAGKTGLPEVDMWLASVNPNQLTAAPEVI